uniref:Nuclear receptor domain-containing protein n=1 Tax=Caenorhabditis tropicalis TaxID=1561998 RepID=A0A1I7UCL2_9PELO
MSSHVIDESRRSALPPKEPNGRICTVCSDRANGYNFGVLTCESCKAFFRRNAAKHKEIKCPFSDSCQITSASRKFCQACRLNKCFSVGMNSEWLNDIKPKTIVTGKFKRKKSEMKNQMKMEINDTEEDVDNEEEEAEEQVSVSKALLEKLINKANEKQKEYCTCKCQCGFYPTTQRLTAFHPIDSVPNSPPEQILSQPTQNPEQPYVYSSSSSYSSTFSPMSVISCAPSSHDSSRYSTPQLVSQSPSNYRVSPPSMIGSLTESSPQMVNQYPPFFSPLQIGMMTQKGPPSFLNFPPMPERTWTPVPPVSITPAIETIPLGLLEKIHKKIDKYSGVLTEDEMNLLQELHIQNEPLNAPLIQWHNPKSIDGVFKIIEEALRRIVNMACQLSLFRELHVEDRKNLLKSGFGELLIVRGLMAFDKSDNSWNHSFGVGGKMEVKVDLLNNPKLGEHYEAHMNLLSTFGEDVRNNEHLMLIFNATVIFHPNVSNLRESNRVHSTQAKYFQMLLKLLTFEYGKARADIAYSDLLNQVVELHRVNRTLLRVFYGLDIAQLDPLIRELCSFE